MKGKTTMVARGGGETTLDGGGSVSFLLLSSFLESDGKRTEERERERERERELMEKH